MMESVTGKITSVKEISTKGGKPMHLIELGGETYSNFGGVPKNLAKWNAEGSEVLVDYVLSADGQYRNIKGVSVLPKVEWKDGQTKDYPIVDFNEDDYVVGGCNTIIQEGGMIMKGCYEEISKLLTHKPEDQGDKAMCNNLFIWVTRERNMRK